DRGAGRLEPPDGQETCTHHCDRDGPRAWSDLPRRASPRGGPRLRGWASHRDSRCLPGLGELFRLAPHEASLTLMRTTDHRPRRALVKLPLTPRVRVFTPANSGG